jgi:hypothetical protein
MGMLLRRHDEYLRQEYNGEGSGTVTADQATERSEGELVADSTPLQTADTAQPE